MDTEGCVIKYSWTNLRHYHSPGTTIKFLAEYSALRHTFDEEGNPQYEKGLPSFRLQSLFPINCLPAHA